VPGLGGANASGADILWGFSFEDAQMDQRTPATPIAQGRHRLPQWGTGLLMVATGALFLACISLGVSVFANRPHNAPQGALNDGMATLAFFLKGVPLTN